MVDAHMITVAKDAFDSFVRIIESLDGYEVGVTTHDGDIYEHCIIEKGRVTAEPGGDRTYIPITKIDRIHIY